MKEFNHDNELLKELTSDIHTQFKYTLDDISNLKEVINKNYDSISQDINSNNILITQFKTDIMKEMKDSNQKLENSMKISLEKLNESIIQQAQVISILQKELKE